MLDDKLNQFLQDEVLRAYFEKSRSVGRFSEYSGADGFRSWKDAHPYLARHIIRTYGDPSSRINVSRNGRRIALTRDRKQTITVELGAGPLSDFDFQKVTKTFADVIFQDRWRSLTSQRSPLWNPI